MPQVEDVPTGLSALLNYPFGLALYGIGASEENGWVQVALNAVIATNPDDGI